MNRVRLLAFFALYKSLCFYPLVRYFYLQVGFLIVDVTFYTTVPALSFVVSGKRHLVGFLSCDLAIESTFCMTYLIILNIAVPNLGKPTTPWRWVVAPDWPNVFAKMQRARTREPAVDAEVENGWIAKDRTKNGRQNTRLRLRLQVGQG